MIDALCALLALGILVALFGDGEYAPYVVLGVLFFALTFPGKRLFQKTPWQVVGEVLLSWFALAVLLVSFGVATGLHENFLTAVILNLMWLVPATQIGGHLAFRAAAPYVFATTPKRAVIVGCHELGQCLAEEIEAHPLQGIVLEGFFDDREPDRLAPGVCYPLVGKFANVARYVKEHHIDLIYLALPMASQPRILSLLDDLRDTTASVYFVPDIFVTDLIQARMDAVGRMPVVAVCDTPFSGLDGVVKRASDIVISTLILVAIAPILLVVAVLVKLSSPGPIIFKQRRYGLDGEEIIVYKFRSMTVCEDGNNINQATKGDSRVTPLGAVLRRTSLDELPQFINVLQGRMSIVGPRPHAVAHNEMYRKLIKGYMVRHKVKPGITGWAQVNGARGETDTLEKMEQRIHYDLEYLRNWSVQLDLKIILRTVLLVFRDAQAY